MQSTFEKNIKNNLSPVAIDYSANHNTLLIAFGGISGELGVTPFEFFNLSNTLATNRIFVRDPAQAWYHRGLPGIAKNLDEIVVYLKNEIIQSQAKKVILVGNSMGGYAAILFGFLLNADIVHAFSPQTFINRLNRIRYFDKRWRKQIKNTYRFSDKQYSDIKTVLKNQDKSFEGIINIYYSQAHRLDKIHAERLLNIPGVTLHSFKKGGHKLVKYLRDTGELSQIINKSL